MKVVALFVVAAEKSSSSFSSSSEKERLRRKAKSRENNVVPSFEVFGNTDDKKTRVDDGRWLVDVREGGVDYEGDG